MCSTGAMPSAPISPLATIVIFPARGAAFLWCWAGAPGRAADAWSGRNAPGFEQRFEPGLAAAESPPGCLHGPTGAHRQNLIGQPGAGGLIEQPLLAKQFKTVAGQQFGPQIAVIAGRIAAVEQVQKAHGEAVLLVFV